MAYVLVQGHVVHGMQRHRPVWDKREENGSIVFARLVHGMEGVQPIGHAVVLLLFRLDHVAASPLEIWSLGLQVRLGLSVGRLPDGSGRRSGPFEPEVSVEELGETVTVAEVWEDAGVDVLVDVLDAADEGGGCERSDLLVDRGVGLG